MSAGPWQNYAASQTAQASGPWQNYIPPQGVPEGTISAAKEPTSLGGKVEQWAQNVSDDIKYGTDKTGIGSVLKAMGAHGVYSGNPQAVGDFMASLPLGLAKATQGAGQVAQGKIAQGAGNVIGGAAQAATIPSAFMAPEIPKAPEAALAVGEQLEKVPVVGRPFASTIRAGRAFQDVNQAIGKQPFTVTPRLSDAAMNVFKESELGGGNVPQVVRKFVQRVTKPGAEPLTFEDARRFASNASGLSVSDWFNMLKNGNMRRLIGEFHGAMNDAVQQAAEAQGQGAKFAQAMKEYQQAKQNLRAFETAAGAAAVKYGYGKLHDLGALLLGGR